MLELLPGLFGVGNVYPHSEPDNYEYRVESLKHCAKIFSYYDRFLLKTIKLESYYLWRDAHQALALKLHLNPCTRALMHVWVSQINND